MTNVSAANRYDLHEAVVKKDIAQIGRLLQNGADINQLGSRRHGYGSALHIAAREGYLDIARLLIDRGAEIDVLDRKDFTPLHNATWNGNLEMTKLLLDAGAEIEASTYDGDTPLTLAQNNNQAQVAAFIQAKLQPSATSEVTDNSVATNDTGVIDISGTYISETTAFGNSGKRFMKRKNGKQIILEQTGNAIIGVDDPRNPKINGTREGNTINFYIMKGNQITGTWEISADGTEMVGKWRTTGYGGGSGEWNLKRLQ